MARVETIAFTPHAAEILGDRVTWRPLRTGLLSGLPQICWENGEPWREVNLWLFGRSHRNDISTLRSAASSLHAYAQWLEQSDPKTNWWDFPANEAERCLWRYRGALIFARDAGKLASSTASARMRAVVQFYRWLDDKRLLSPRWPMWVDKVTNRRVLDAHGFARSIAVASTDLTIVNRSRIGGERLEGGLMPVSDDVQTAISKLAKKHTSIEFFLMLSLGFATGMRIGSIVDLKESTFANAVQSNIPEAWEVSIGPNANPPVHTKFRRNGSVVIPNALFEDIREYITSPRRLKRYATAAPQFKQILFLTRFGHRYASIGSDASSAMNVEMSRFRKIARKSGLNLNNFKFHQTRATFATNLAKIAIHTEGVNPIELVAECLFHKDEATAMRYVTFVKKLPTKAILGNNFTKAFFGLSSKHEEKGDA